MMVPGAMQALAESTKQGGVPQQTLERVHLRASRINGCSVCVDLAMRAGGLRKAGETGERLFAVAAWRDAPYFTGAERAALALAEAVTWISDRQDPVPDATWEEAARHYDERGLATLIVHIAMTNVWNRLNVTTRQVAGEWAKSPEGRARLESLSASR
jgi:AhpD family alkylhydroperoxidase